ncbi:MAG: N-acetylmuramoyl-L-alanine amidase [Oscillospiraceae bacterium]
MKITEMFLTPSKYVRPQFKLEKVRKIAVHYVGNPNTSALANRNYFESCGKTGARYVSSHYIIGLEGEIIQCIPLDEWSYCTNQANGYSISIECCHPDSTGKFTDETEKSLAELCAFLCKKFGLTEEDIIRHYDVTGKQCPLYWSPTKYVSKETADRRFNAFKSKVAAMLGKSTESESFPYKVRITDTELNVRKDAGTNNPVVFVLKKGEVYTIVDEKNVNGYKWGLLKSYAGKRNGWISLKYTERVR